jgi:predicted metal-dependent hydrolase
VTPLDWKLGELADGLRLYRERNYFEAHEEWEAVWRRSQGADKTFVQAMIQLAAACHHFERGNRSGARSLVEAALKRLKETGDAFDARQLLELQDNLQAWLAALDTPGAIDAKPSAQIRRLQALDHRDNQAF